MKVTYTGPFPAVVIADTGQTAKRGQAIDVRDDVAARLCDQDTWTASSVPARNAPKRAWLDAAAAAGHTDLDDLTKDELIELVAPDPAPADTQED